MNTPPATTTLNPIKYIVLDAGAFISGEPLSKFGAEVEYCTIQEVLNEVRDKQSRRALEMFPFRIQVMSGSTESLNTVSAFAKRVGDLYSLSLVDLKVLALTYELEIRQHGEANLKNTPPDVGHSASNNAVVQQPTIADDKKVADVVSGDDDNNNNNSSESVAIAAAVEDDNNNDDSDGEWITPQNLEMMKTKSMTATGRKGRRRRRAKAIHTSQSSVACITTDYTMQNVMIQMGLRLLSVRGMAITSVKHFVLRCHACNTVTADMSKLFCPGCGNGGTLIRVSKVVRSDGTVAYYGGQKKAMNLRGTRYTLPPPTGGRHRKEREVITNEAQLWKYPHLRPMSEQRKRKEGRGHMFSDAVEFGISKTSGKQPNQTPFVVGQERNPNETRRHITGRRKRRTRNRRRR